MHYRRYRRHYRRNPESLWGRRRNPWAASDVKRHNKRCAKRKACRLKWPKIANAVLRDSGDKGKAIRIANWQVNRMGLNRRLRRRNPIYGRWRRNSMDVENSCNFCHIVEAEDGCHRCDVRWCAGCRYEHECPHEMEKRYNPYSFYRNPSEEEDMRTIERTLSNITPCDKKDWGLARRFRFRNRRNPYGICLSCMRRY